MSRLGKSFKNRFLKRALAMMLAGTMVMSGMPVSVAAESAETEALMETEVQTETEKPAEEAAEDGEVVRKETEEAQEKESTNNPVKESEAVSEKASTAVKEDKETTVSNEGSEVEESETDTEEASETENSEEENEAANTATYSVSEGETSDFVKYNMEGYASSYDNKTGVTGGGLLKPENDNYYLADTEEKFLNAILAARNANGKPVVIEITKDMNLGNLELGEQGIEILDATDKENNPLSRVILKDKETPLTHPTLEQTGVSSLTIQDTSNLTIFSQNGSSIKHCGIIIKKSSNIMIRNITFDELWEWDEGGTNTSGKTCEPGDYDRNDWDYIGIQDSDGIWIDHCTFYKAYDGIVDIKFASSTAVADAISNVTISWCRFMPESKGSFFTDMMDYLKTNKDEKNKDDNTKLRFAYYNELLGKGLDHQDIVHYAHGHKKTHLLGQDDDVANAAGIKLTLANNYYYDSMDRMPRLRHGTVHEYNCVLDSQNLYDWKTSNEVLGSKITSNGALSTCSGKMLLENCYIKGITKPLISGNAESSPGEINAVDSLYYIGTENKTSELKPENNNSDKYLTQNNLTEKPKALITDVTAFRNALPYKGSYVKYDASKLNTDIVPLTGAGKVTMSEVQWEMASYGTPTPEPDENESSEATTPTQPEQSETQDSSSESGDTDGSSSDEADSSSDEDFSGASESSDVEGSTEDDTKVIDFSLSGDDFELETGADNKPIEKPITSPTEKNGFTIKATSSANVIIDGSSKTIEGKKFKQRIKLIGAGDEDKRSIHFTAEDTGTLTVYVASAGSDVRQCVLYKAGRIEVDRKDATGTPASITFPIEEEGEYFIAGNKGINIYYINFSNKKEEPTPPDDEYAPVEVDAKWTTLPALTAESVYSADEAKDSSKVQYNQEGYAGAANVTGGGLIKEGTTGYYTVTNEEEFLKALKAVQNVTDKPNVIEITTDLNLGKLELKEKFNIDVLAKGEGSNEYSGVIKAYTIQPRMHPTLKKTGVSYLNMHGFQNLTIFSKNGATIKHAGMKFEDQSTKNIIIRNLAFDELWEWDEGGLDAKGKEQKPGDYDINDWDYMVIDEHAEGIWIDHCTFYKAYDGLIDIKNNSSDDKYFQRVTISWCEFLPGSKDNVFFNEQMKWLEDNINNEEEDIAYYRQLRQTENMSKEAVWWYAYGQKKTHLFGSGDSATEDKVMRVTLANNYYKNAQSRLPRLRFGKVHEYNCVLDSHQMNEQYKNGNKKITGNGANSTDKGEMLIENNYIRGVRTPLRSGYDSVGGYINAVGSVYYMSGKKTELTITNSSTDGLKVTDEAKFKEKLPEGYVATTYDATQLYNTVVPYAGAGKVDMTTVQWEATNYGTNDKGSETPASPSSTESSSIAEKYDKTPTFPSWDTPDNPDDPVKPTVAAPKASHADGTEFPSGGGKITLSCDTDGAAIYYTKAATESDLKDPSAETNTDRIPYEPGTEISITEETYIWAVAIKEGVVSEPLKCHYIVLAEGAVVKPAAKPGSGPVPSGTKVELYTTDDTIEKIYFTTGSTPDATLDPRQEDSGRQEYKNNETEIIITEAVTIKAVAQKGDKLSEVTTFTYTIKTEEDPGPGPGNAVAKPTFSKAEGPAQKGDIVTIDCATEGASIYYTTDETEPKAEEQYLYIKGTEIVIEQTITIRAIAVKDGKTSEENKVTYTVEGTENPPVDPDTPLEPDDPGIDKSDIWITGLEEIYYFTGAKIIPDIKVWDCDIKGNDRLLVPGVDYSVAYKNNTKVTTDPTKTPTITITGKGNYTGKKVTETFKIEYAKLPSSPIEVKGAKVELLDAKYAPTYDGTAKYPDFNLVFKGKTPATYKYRYQSGKYALVDDSGKELEMNVSIAVSNNVNKGTATILVTGKEIKGKATSVKKTFKIMPIDLSKAKVTVTSSAATYAVKGAVPETVKVECDGKTLLKGIDYTVKYSNNKKTGTKVGTITITGKGNYTRKPAAQAKFDINPLDLSKVSVSAVTAYENITAKQIKATVVDGDGNALKASQYKLNIYKEDGTTLYAATDRTKLVAGTKIYVEATLPAQPKDNSLTGTTPKAEFIVGKNISKAKFKLQKNLAKEYTGRPIELKAEDFLSVTYKDKSGTSNLKMDEHFEIVSYSNNINKGTATAVIKGINGYSGTTTVRFKIKQKEMIYWKK